MLMTQTSEDEWMRGFSISNGESFEQFRLVRMMWQKPQHRGFSLGEMAPTTS